MSSDAAPPSEATKRLVSKKQTLDDAYAAPANFLEIDVSNPITHGVARKRYTDYEVRMKVCVRWTSLGSSHSIQRTRLPALNSCDTEVIYIIFAKN